MLTGSMLFFTGTMSADASAFSCLPLAVRDSLLQQAFQQLDQRHLFGVAPRVCRLWHQLSLSIITSLDVKITTEEAAEQLDLWIVNHGDTLVNMQLDSTLAVCQTRAGRSVLRSLGAAAQLRSLSILTNSSGTNLDVALPPLANLTHLSIDSCSVTPTMLSSILSFRSLNSLSLCYMYVMHGANIWVSWSSMMEQMATSLVGLTSLDLGFHVSSEGLAHLRALPQLNGFQ